MTDDQVQHVFVSYVRQDSAQVDALCRALEAAQILYWRDRTSLAPGDAWKSEIRQAIQQGSLVFLACFSENTRARQKSQMNEELTLAVEEYRKMPPGRTWLIPVRFDDGELPEWDLGAGRALSDLNYVDLFGDSYAVQLAALVTTIHRLSGQKRPSAASAMAAVEQAALGERADMLKRMTKEMLLDPSRRIQLDDLVSQEAQRVVATLRDPDRVATGKLQGSNDEQILAVTQQAQEYWEEAEPFCRSLQVAVRWAPPEGLGPWASGLQAMASAANRIEGGNEALLRLRHVPALAAIMTAAVASVGALTWENLREVVLRRTVTDRYQSGPVPVLDATHPDAPFVNEGIANVLAHSVIKGNSFNEALDWYNSRGRRGYYTPVADWLHSVLRLTFDDQFPDEEAYDAAFERAEIMLGLLSQDDLSQRYPAEGDNAWRASTSWFGRSTWRSHERRHNPVDEIARELASERAAWGPLQAGLFSGELSRAERAIELYGKAFREMSRRRY